MRLGIRIQDELQEEDHQRENGEGAGQIALIHGDTKETLRCPFPWRS
jgi:hypothetical protein